jgi:hypothetical protein
MSPDFFLYTADGKDCFVNLNAVPLFEFVNEPEKPLVASIHYTGNVMTTKLRGPDAERLLQRLKKSS